MELYLPQVYEFYRYNPVNGRFLKGHIPANKGEKMSPEKYEKCKATMFKKGNKSTRKYGQMQKNQKPVEMWKDGEFITYFFSMGRAEKTIGIWRRNIGKVLNGERKNAGGFQWKLGRKLKFNLK